MSGNRIFELRTKNKLTREEFAKRLYISESKVSEWENDISIPNLDEAKEIAIEFQLNSIDELIDDPWERTKREWKKEHGQLSYQDEKTIYYKGCFININFFIKFEIKNRIPKNIYDSYFHNFEYLTYDKDKRAIFFKLENKHQKDYIRDNYEKELLKVCNKYMNVKKIIYIY